MQEQCAKQEGKHSPLDGELATMISPVGIPVELTADINSFEAMVQGLICKHIKKGGQHQMAVLIVFDTECELMPIFEQGYIVERRQHWG